MNNAVKLMQKLRNGRPCVGTCMTSTDWTLTEALSDLCDLIFLDLEHSAIHMETMQAHAIAVKNSDAALLVRTPRNDPAWIKPILDAGADGIIAPMIRSADDVKRLVDACLFPPQGTRGFGPRRANQFGGYPATEFIERANASILPIPQLEHIDAIKHLDSILDVSGYDMVLIGPNDLAGSMGMAGQPDCPRVQEAISMLIKHCLAAHKFVGVATGDDPHVVSAWYEKDVRWLALGTEYSLLRRAARELFEPLHHGQQVHTP